MEVREELLGTGTTHTAAETVKERSWTQTPQLWVAVSFSTLVSEMAEQPYSSPHCPAPQDEEVSAELY